MNETKNEKLSHRYNINRPKLRYGHKYTKHKKTSV